MGTSRSRGKILYPLYLDFLLIVRRIIGIFLLKVFRLSRGQTIALSLATSRVTIQKADLVVNPTIFIYAKPIRILYIPKG